MASPEPVDPSFPSITAAVSSQTCDASAALLVVSESALKRYNLTPRRASTTSVCAAMTRSGI